MRRTTRPFAARLARVVAVVTLLAMSFLVLAPAASAQDVDQVVRVLESSGYYIEQGAEGSDARFRDLVRQADGSGQNWYFLSMASPIDANFAEDVFDVIEPAGNVLVYFLDGEFAEVRLVTAASDSVRNNALAPFDSDWSTPEDFMGEVVTEFDRLTGASTSTTSTSSDSSSSGSSSGGGFPWALVGIPVVLGGGFWFMSRRSKKAKAEEQQERAQKIRAELQTELDELANDVLVLSGPVDVSENDQAITYYREATDTYLSVADEMPEPDELEQASLKELAEYGSRVSHARWQMDAAEALISGEPVPEEPVVQPPPPQAPPRPREQQREQQRQRMPQRQPRPRVPYSRSRQRSGGGLLDILIAGSGMLGSSRGRSGGMFGGGSRGRSGGMFGGGSRGRSGGMFGGSSRSGSGRSQSPRPGGGVFGGGQSSRSSSRSSSRGSSRSSSRTSSSRRRPRNRSTTSRRRIR